MIKTYIKSNSERQKVFWNIATGKIMVCINNNKSYIYIYIRWVQVTPSVTLKSYTFSKPLDLSRSNSKKNALINANIMIKISFIILIYNIPYLSLIPKIGIFSLCSLILIHYMFLSPPLLFNLHFHKVPPPQPHRIWWIKNSN